MSVPSTSYLRHVCVCVCACSYEGAINQIDAFNSLIDSLTLRGCVLDPKVCVLPYAQWFVPQWVYCHVPLGV